MPDAAIPRPVATAMANFERTVGSFFRAKMQTPDDTDALVRLDLAMQRDLDRMNAAITKHAWTR